MTEIPSVYTDRIFLSVNTDKVNGKKNSIGKYHSKISTKKTHR